MLMARGRMSFGAEPASLWGDQQVVPSRRPARLRISWSRSRHRLTTADEVIRVAVWRRRRRRRRMRRIRAMLPAQACNARPIMAKSKPN